MAGEIGPAPSKYTVERVDRLQEGVPPTLVAEQAMAVLCHRWSLTASYQENAEAVAYEMLSGDGITVVAMDAYGVVVATATCKPDARQSASPGWAMLQGVAEVPEVDSDQTGQEQRTMALGELEKLARADGIVRLSAGYIKDLGGEQITYYVERQGYKLLRKPLMLQAELYKDL